jgi:subtilisin family serine protease
VCTAPWGGHSDIVIVKSASQSPTLSVPRKAIKVRSGALAMKPWGIGAVKASTSLLTGEGVTVAVLDTGIDKGHSAFEDVELIGVRQDHHSQYDRRFHSRHGG